MNNTSMQAQESAVSTTTPWKQPQISYWQRRAPLSLMPAPLPQTSQVVVIGAGLMGACSSYWLSRRGIQVTVLEQQAPAFGATGRNGGFHVIGTAESYASAIERHGHETARAIYMLTLRSRTLLREVLAEEGLECEYREPGRINLALSEDQFAESARSVKALHADGVSIDLLDRAQMQALINTPLGPDICGGIYSSEDGMLQPVRFVQGVLAAAQRHGARMCAATVLKVHENSDGVSVQTSAGTIHAETLIVCANAWTSQLLPALEGIIRPVRGQALAFAPLPQVFKSGVGAAVTSTGEYWHQTPEGAIVLGGCRAIAPGGEVGVTSEGTTPEVQQALEQVFPQLFPELHGLQVQQRWSGLMAFTNDYMPICDTVPDQPHIWYVGGFCGHGMPFGMSLGDLLAEAAASGKHPEGLRPLRLDRPTLG